MRRFWTMLAHYHGQTCNGSELGHAMSLSDKTVRSYLDILTGTFMVRQLQPWHENIKKRQVKAQKVHPRDSGILHSLLSITDRHTLVGHPKVGASWEGMALEQALQLLRPSQAYFWATTQQGGTGSAVFPPRPPVRNGIQVHGSSGNDEIDGARRAGSRVGAHLGCRSRGAPIPGGKEHFRVPPRGPPGIA